MIQYNTFNGSIHTNATNRNYKNCLSVSGNNNKVRKAILVISSITFSATVVSLIVMSICANVYHQISMLHLSYIKKAIIVLSILALTSFITLILTLCKNTPIQHMHMVDTRAHRPLNATIRDSITIPINISKHTTGIPGVPYISCSNSYGSDTSTV